MKRINLLALAELPVPGPKGPRSLLAGAIHCTRCNACVQACPAYLKHRKELFSPRGRVQFIRLLTEKKIKTREAFPVIQEMTKSCLLCTRCTAACAGQVPVPHFMLALRRNFSTVQLPKSLSFILSSYGSRPRLFKFLRFILQTARQTGLLALLEYTGLLHLSKQSWLAHIRRILPQSARPLKKCWHQQTLEVSSSPTDSIYLPSLEAQYIDSSVGLLSLQALAPKKIYILFDTPSGFFESVYGSRTLGLQQARRLLVQWEKLSGGKNIPLVTDSIEVYTFLKNYPFLFFKFPHWQKRAVRFAEQVHFISQYIKPAKKHKTAKAALAASGVLYPAGEIEKETRKILLTHFGKNLLECEYSRFPLPAAAEAFTQDCMAKETVLENVKDIAQKQIKQVYCLSFWSALELEVSLRRNYPEAEAFHITHLQAEP